MKRFLNGFVLCAMGCALAMQGCDRKGNEAPPAAGGGAGNAPNASPGGSGAQGSASGLDALRESTAAMANEAQKKAAEKVAEVSGALRDAAEGYVSSMSEMADLLHSIRSQAHAQEKLDQIVEMRDRVAGYLKTIEEAAPETSAALREQLQSRLEPIMQKYDSQIKRVANDPRIKPLLGDILSAFPTWQ